MTMRPVILAALPLAASGTVNAQALWTFTPLAQADHARALDLDGDGDLDFIFEVEQPSPRMAWRENLGSGQFGPERDIAPFAPAHFSDIDGDGDLDLAYLVAGVAFNLQLRWFENTGAGQPFVDRGIQSGGIQTGGGARRDRFLDADGDGDDDVLVQINGSSLAVYENVGGGALGQQLTIVTSGVGSHSWSTQVVDFDTDGLDDIIHLRIDVNGLHAVEVYRNTGGAFAIAAGESGLDIPVYDTAVPVDFDTDGDIDVVVSRVDDWCNNGLGTSSEVFWFENIGSGAFAPKQIIETAGFTAFCQPEPRIPRVFAIGDIDGDGGHDLVTGTTWRPGFGDPTAASLSYARPRLLRAQITYPASSLFIVQPTPQRYVDTPTLADLDGDSRADAFGELAGGIHGWWRNTEIATTYCEGLPNSTGDTAELAATGTTGTTGVIELTGSGLPSNSTTLLLASLDDGFAVMPSQSGGILCVGGSIGRYSTVMQSTFDGSVRYLISGSIFPQPTGTVVGAPGETWHFQLWHRDSTAPSNFTSAVRVELQ